MIKFGIIGCGRIGQRHAEHISKLGKLVSVCDIILTKAQMLADKYEAKRKALLAQQQLEAAENALEDLDDEIAKLRARKASGEI